MGGVLFSAGSNSVKAESAPLQKANTVYLRCTKRTLGIWGNS